jgi:1-acyl-sn-glycerol-3-phosphate acyltransferase
MSTLGYQYSSPQRLANFLLPLMGWQVESPLPDVRQCVLVVAPHTSAWDLPIGLVCAHALGLFARWQVAYMAKHTLFRGSLGVFMRLTGGIPINRTAAHSVVDQMAEAFQTHERLMLAITPEGTRKHTGYWKSGFYHIALKAGVPIVPAFLDYGRRVAGVGEPLMPTGDVEGDLAVLRQFFSKVTAKFPHEVGEMRFKSE